MPKKHKKKRKHSGAGLGEVAAMAAKAHSKDKPGLRRRNTLKKAFTQMDISGKGHLDFDAFLQATKSDNLGEVRVLFPYRVHLRGITDVFARFRVHPEKPAQGPVRAHEAFDCCDRAGYPHPQKACLLNVLSMERFVRRRDAYLSIPPVNEHIPVFSELK